MAWIRPRIHSSFTRSRTTDLERLRASETRAERCRAGRVQRNHAACALPVWSRLEDLAYQGERTVHQVEHGLLRGGLIEQLKNPTVRTVLA